MDPNEVLADRLFRRPVIMDPDIIVDQLQKGADPATVTAPRYAQRKKTAFDKWVRGSAWWASAPSFLAVLIATIGILLLLDLVIEEKFTTLFPIDSFFLTWLGAILGFALTFQWSFEQGLWADQKIQTQGIADDVVTLAWLVTQFVNAKKLRDDVAESYEYTGLYELNRNVTRKLYEIMREINVLIRVYPMAVDVDNTIRMGDPVPPIDEADWPNNLDDKGIIALNLPVPLLAELASYLAPNVLDIEERPPRSGVSDQLLHMIGLRLHTLLKSPQVDGDANRKDVAREFFGPNLYVGATNQIGAISSRSSALHANRIVSSHPIIKGLLVSTTMLYVLLVPLIAWGSYRWWTLAITPVFQWALLAFLYAGRLLENQYIPYNRSNYVHSDARQIAVDAAFAVDRVFDAYYRLGGIEHKPVKWRQRTNNFSVEPNDIP